MQLPPLPQAFASLGLQSFVTLVPLLVYGGLTKTSKKIFPAFVLVVACFALDTLLLFMPRLPFSHNLHWNWQGKALEVVAFLLLGKLIKLSRRQSGFCLPKNFRAVLVGAIIGAVYAVAGGPQKADNAETLAYEWTMPGLGEELSFRGVMLGILDHRLGRPWKMLGVQFGLGAIITSVFFCLGHVLFFTADWELYFDPSDILDQLSFAFLMCWLRYRYESIIPAIVAHNVSNGLAFCLPSSWKL